MFAGAVIVLYRIAVAVLGKQKSDKPQQPDDFSDLLIIERVSGEYQAETELQILRRAHNELLSAGDALLNKLSVSTRKSLSKPVSRLVWEEMRDRLSEGDKPECFTIERVRAAFAVAEASLAIESLMRCSVRCSSSKAVFYEQQDLVRFYNQENPSSYQTVPYSYLIGRISSETGVSDAVSKELLRGIISLLREGKVRVPGLLAEAFEN